MQPSLIDLAPPFDGPDLEPADHERLTGQLARIKQFMSSGEWWDLHTISEVTRAPESSVSAQLRNLRKSRFGSHTIERRHLGHGLYQYRLVI